MEKTTEQIFGGRDSTVCNKDCSHDGDLEIGESKL